MTTKIVTTNLRIPEDEWIAAKSLAAELGMSVNELTVKLLSEIAIKSVMAPDVTIVGRKKKRKKNIWDELRNLSRIKGEPLGPLSEDDKAVYET